MQLDYYEPGGLSGFSLSKLFKKVEKVAKPLVHVGAAIYTGGASLALSTQMMRASAARKNEAAIRAAQLEAEKAASSPDWGGEVVRDPRMMYFRPQPSVPGWVVPVAVGGGVLALVLLINRR